jgi:uncharacterized glyoxalase superfamily protein PhnB
MRPIASRRYLRFRARHEAADSAWFWLGKKGRVTDSGVRQMLERRCLDAGIPPVHPHQFRHASRLACHRRAGARPDAVSGAHCTIRPPTDDGGAPAAFYPYYTSGLALGGCALDRWPNVRASAPVITASCTSTDSCFRSPMPTWPEHQHRLQRLPAADPAQQPWPSGLKGSSKLVGRGDVMKSNRSIPAATVIPVLTYPDVRKAVAWLSSSFGSVERVRIGENHRAQLSVGDGAVIVADTGAKRRSPDRAATTHSVTVRVDDVQGQRDRAARHGAVIVVEPTDYPFGERQCIVFDPWGHQRTFSQTVADVAPEVWVVRPSIRCSSWLV